jgi:hypothetical protein
MVCLTEKSKIFNGMTLCQINRNCSEFKVEGE